MGQHRLGIGLISGIVQLHHMDTGRGHIVHMQELAHRCTSTPDHQLFVAALNRFMEAAQQGRDHMAVLRVIVIMGAIQIGRHYAAVITTMLTVIAFTQLDPGDLGNRIGLIGGLQGTGEQGLFAHRLLSMLGVNAR